MRFIDDIRYIKNQVFTILMNVKSINILVKNMYDKMFNEPEDSDRVKLLEEQVDCLIKNKFEDGQEYDSIVLVPSTKMSDMGQMPTIIHRGEKINTDNMTSFNLSWSYGDGAILTTEKELRNFSNDIDRVIDKKLGDYGFDSENINR